MSHKQKSQSLKYDDPSASDGAPERNKVYHTDALTLLKAMPSGSVNCIVTSPPYFGLRDYQVDGQIGLEETPREYVDKLVMIFHEARRVLRDDGVLWVNIGDSYAGGGNYRGINEETLSPKQRSNGGSHGIPQNLGVMNSGLPPKSLLGIPWRVAFGLQDDGWILRSDVIWHKPNPMPESVTDRPTKAHEYVFLFAKSGKYFYDKDAIATPVKPDSIKRQGRAVSDTHKNLNGAPGQPPHSMFQPRPNKQDALGKRTYAGFNERYENAETPMANKRSVWTVPTVGFPGAHFATFPPDLIEPMILAGCPAGGLVLDPFMGSGTTALVARSHGRDYIGSELNSEYVEIARERLAEPYTLPMLFENESPKFQATYPSLKEKFDES